MKFYFGIPSKRFQGKTATKDLDTNMKSGKTGSSRRYIWTILSRYLSDGRNLWTIGSSLLNYTFGPEMDLSDIPFGIPIILQSIYKVKNLQNPLGSKHARCLTDNRDGYEQLLLHRIGDKVAIQAKRNDRFMRVCTNGDCVFDRREPRDSELFTMETDRNCALYFVSCLTGNVLQCDNNFVAKCDNTNRKGWEEWRIVMPLSTYQAEHTLGVKDRMDVVVELASFDKTADEIEKIVRIIFD
ncbi:hypothetical protein PsorP6_013465 [Peronosclerospora sorghi]|uniref:Uncharacterized protein n=1 Tax=Peronosclerospora sorghi TaxID=230839 RepID=A0ACC0VGG5_9STRA|nr:hypothetical protein PsorP6_013465 [Peronosclerospora sorghi]